MHPRVWRAYPRRGRGSACDVPRCAWSWPPPSPLPLSLKGRGVSRRPPPGDECTRECAVLSRVGVAGPHATCPGVRGRGPHPHPYPSPLAGEGSDPARRDGVERRRRVRNGRNGLTGRGLRRFRAAPRGVTVEVGRLRPRWGRGVSRQRRDGWSSPQAGPGARPLNPSPFQGEGLGVRVAWIKVLTWAQRRSRGARDAKHVRGGGGARGQARQQAFPACPAGVCGPSVDGRQGSQVASG